MAEILETAIRAENAAIRGTPFSAAAIQPLMPPMAGQHSVSAIRAASANCGGWPAFAGRLRAAATDFESGASSRKHRLLTGVNRILLSAAELAHSARKAGQLRSLLPSGGRSWARDCRIAAETDAVARRNPKEPISLVTVETRGHLHAKKAGILRLTRILEIRACGDRLPK